MGFFCSLLFLSLSQYLHSVALFSSDYLVNCIEYMTNKMTNILDNLDLRVIYQLNFISHEISKWHNVVASCVLLTELPCKYKILCSMLLCRHQQMLSKVFFFYFLFVCVCVCVFFGVGGKEDSCITSIWTGFNNSACYFWDPNLLLSHWPPIWYIYPSETNCLKYWAVSVIFLHLDLFVFLVYNEYINLYVAVFYLFIIVNVKKLE